MENFQFCIPTNVLFGKDQIKQLPEVIAGFGKKVLLVYGGGSIKRMGLYDTVRTLLSDCEVFEVAGVAPNSRIDSVREGVALCRLHHVDVILAVGGGSVIDCAKAIAAAVYDEGDAWDMIASHHEITQALPIVTVLTLAATGSEADAGAVISTPQTNEKLAFMSEKVYPAVSIMDPTYTFTVPANQTAAGSFDILSHLMEQYFVPASSYLSDLLVESVMKTVIRYAPIAIEKPDDYEARAQLMWAGTIADNATLCNGNQLAAFSCHGIEHELSAYHDVTHGVGLAIVTPRWMRYVLEKSPETTTARFAHFARAVWKIDEADDALAAQKGIEAVSAFAQTMHIPATLGEVGMDNAHFEAMAVHAVEAEGLAYAWLPLDASDVAAILSMCL